MVVVEIWGEGQTGKTHCALSFPKPVVLDMTNTQESQFEVLKNWDELKNYVYVPDHTDVKKALEIVDKIAERNDRHTIVVETSIDLRDAFGDVWCEKYGKEKVYPPEAYGQVNDLVDDEFIVPYSRKYNIVFVSIMDEEYAGGKKTGRRIRKGYNRLDFMCDMRFKTDVQSHNMKVMKNRFIDVHSDDYVETVYNEWQEIRKLIPAKKYRDYFVK